MKYFKIKENIKIQLGGTGIIPSYRAIGLFWYLRMDDNNNIYINLNNEWLLSKHYTIKSIYESYDEISEGEMMLELL